MKSIKEIITDILNDKYFGGVVSLESIDSRKLLAKIEFQKNYHTELFSYEESSLYEYLTDLTSEITFLRHLHNMKKCKMGVIPNSYKDENNIIKFEISIIF